ncbi:MAG TPA: methylated-DNA--[protein]-cysteine S-methyltransferase [Tepidisphaeraceae bacterium]|jgi:methylated-DNA-[protein]-cysteine S-methyltransferase|nr:methylated-DNA--[protein]-cysteine S-methyltransferase [Tepidisphaeraceae bacterium]
MSLIYKQIPSPVGRLKLVATDHALVAILWENDKPARVKLAAAKLDNAHPLLTRAENQLSEYFAGQRTTFDLPLAPIGTPFQQKVWHALTQIPYAQTSTYGSLARSIGSPTASRAVGAAIGRNPLSILIPCHRVIGASGKLTGFAGGLETKSFLLTHELTTAHRQR